MKATKFSWSYVAFGLSGIILLGMSLPWAEGLNFNFKSSSKMISSAQYVGWNLIWLVLPALVAIVSCIVAYLKKEQKKWLWAAFISAIVSLIVMIIFGINMAASQNSLMFSDSPLYGFWVTLLGFIGLTGIVGRNLFEKKLPQKDFHTQTN